MKKLKTLFWLLALLPGLMVGCSANQKPDEGMDDSEEPIIPLKSTATVQEEVIRVAYCPTMANELSLLEADGVFIEGVQYPSAVQAVQALQDGAADAALIGRKPYQAELAVGFNCVQLRDGFTLIAQEKKIIPYADLAAMTIYTELLEEEIEDVFPAATHIIHYSGYELPEISDNRSALLIRWDQVENPYNLLIPIDSQGNKIKDFRTPFLIFPETCSHLLEDIYSAD